MLRDEPGSYFQVFIATDRKSNWIPNTEHDILTNYSYLEGLPNTFNTFFKKFEVYPIWQFLLFFFQIRGGSSGALSRKDACQSGSAQPIFIVYIS